MNDKGKLGYSDGGSPGSGELQRFESKQVEEDDDYLAGERAVSSDSETEEDEFDEDELAKKKLKQPERRLSIVEQLRNKFMKENESDEEDRAPPKPLDIFNRPKFKDEPPKPIDPKLLEPDEQDLYFKLPRIIEPSIPPVRSFVCDVAGLRKLKSVDEARQLIRSQQEGCELQVGNSNAYLIDVGSGGLIAFGGDYLSLA